MTDTASPLVPFAGGWEAHRHRHCVWIVSPEFYVFSRAFDEVAEVLSSAFDELGGSAPVVRQPVEWGDRVPIILGGNILTKFPDFPIPPSSVLFNLEQMQVGNWWFTPEAGYLDLLHRYPVLDWSPTNLQRLRRVGIEHAQLLGIGYAPHLSRINPASEKPIDVLFYGALTDRRRALLSELRAAGLQVTAPLDPLFGEQRDSLVAQAKVVLNIHAEEGNAFEAVRVFYLMANRVAVVSEGSPDEPDAEWARGGIEFAPYEALAERCIAVVRDHARRDQLAQAGFERISARRQSDLLRQCVLSAGVA